MINISTLFVVKVDFVSLWSFLYGIELKKYYIIDVNVWRLYSYFFRFYISNSYILVKRGENCKNFFYVFKVINLLLKFGFLRDTVLVAIGGGVVGDISGFVSSIYMRGINFIIVPTTLLSQVDSSVGGKNGVNTFYGKNLVGVIRHPSYVINISNFIFTLSYSVYIFGFSELFKVMLINSPWFYRYFFDIDFIVSRVGFVKLLKLGISSKVRVLIRDVNDIHDRLKLNLGHTFGHAIELSSSFLIQHGLAVFIGLFMALKFSYYVFNISSLLVFSLLILLNVYVPGIYNYVCYFVSGMYSYIAHDKKSSFSYVKFVLFRNIGHVSLFSVSLVSVRFMFLTE